uniref:SAM domain-containing protein n=1 Tax=Ciona intestinalis TaxID=7719 RepID=H2XX58_CIOIN
MSTRYHRAACDNRLDVLKEATKKDLNQQDDGGMTPTLWAAYYGFLPALRVCCSRGGQVDKCDYLGNTALHLAAQNGHLDSVSFLVNFGANVWKVDNSYNSAQDLAGIRNQTKCVKYLDQQVAKMTVENGKQAKKMKEQAKKEAEKRIVKFEKMQNKMKQKIEKDSSAGMSASHYLYKMLYLWLCPARNTGRALKKLTLSSLYRRKLSTTNSVEEKSNGRKYSSSTMNNPRKISSSNKPANAMTSLHNQVMQDYDDGGELNEDGTPSYVKPDKTLTTNLKIGSDHKLHISFFFAISFYILSGSKSYIPYTYVFAKYESKQTDDDNFSLGESDSAEELTELEFFLNSIKLEDYIPLFQDEKMDMEALALCTSDDLIQMGLPLGPRKKILQGLSEREKPDSGNELTLL